MADVVYDVMLAELEQHFQSSSTQKSTLMQEVLEQAILTQESNASHSKEHYEKLASLYRQQGLHEKANHILYKRRRVEV